MSISPLLTSCLLAAVCTSGWAVPGSTPVDYAKTVDVSVLDPTLPSQPLVEWLRVGPARIDQVQWDVSNCCNCDRRDKHLCVRFRFNKTGVSGYGMLRIGTHRQGVTGRAHLDYIQVPPKASSLTKLSDLPGVITDLGKVVTYGRLIDVRTLDPSLPSQSLDEWLRVGPARMTRVDWTISDCDLKPSDNVDEHNPLCVKFVFNRSKASGFGVIRVGTIRQGIVGSPRLEHVLVSQGEGATMRFETTAKLSDVPRVIAKYF